MFIEIIFDIEVVQVTCEAQRHEPDDVMHV